MLAIEPACAFQEAVSGITKQHLPLQWREATRFNPCISGGSFEASTYAAHQWDGAHRSH